MKTSSTVIPWFRAFLLFTLALTLFWPTLLQMESIWRRSETYMHCYFIVPMTLYMIWTQRSALTGLRPKPALLPALMMLPLLTLWLSAYAIDVGFVSHISQVLMFQLLLWHLLGHQISKAIRFPLLFLIFSAPFGESLTPALQEITADMGVALLRMADIPVYREGLYLHTTVSVFEVAVACSGLNFLISSAVISLLFAFLYFQKLYKKIIFVAFVLVLAILANGLRAFILMFIGEKTDMVWGFGDDHYYYGWAVFALTMLISFRIGELFADATPASSAADLPVQKTEQGNKRQMQSWQVSALAFALLLVFYPLRALLPQIERPETTPPVFEITGFNPLKQNRLGNSFNDGIRRSALQNAEGIEILAADYAVRQNEGDMITWHNWVFNQKMWTITDREIVGSLLDSHQLLQLMNIQGRQYTVLYWYQMGDIRSTNQILMKLLQLKAILLHEPVASGVRMLAVPDQEFSSGKQLLQQLATETTALTQPPQPYDE